MENRKEIIIVPDVHGRDFWKSVRKYAKTHTIVFLGDYLDPYPSEGVSREQAYRNFKEILCFKKENWDSVHLLLGNHDIGYLYPGFCTCRKDVPRAGKIGDILFREMKSFDMEYNCSWGDRYVCCSHAGIHPEWERRHPRKYSVADYYNYIFHHIVDEFDGRLDIEMSNLFFLSMRDISYKRGGDSEVGSMVWADIHEFEKVRPYPGFLQIVGHTQQQEGPLWINDGMVCVDCRKVFRYDLEKGELRPLED